MKRYDVLLTPSAESDLLEIGAFIADESGFPDVAIAYIERLRDKCQHQLSTAPHRGQQRDDLSKGLRVLPLEKNTVVAFKIDQKKQIVVILNFFYGGRDYDAIMS